MKEKKGVAILGSTGSIGTQALEVIDANPNDFDLQVITANKNADLLINQAIKFRPNNVVIVDESLYNKVQDALFQYDIHVYTGEESLLDVVCGEDIDIVLTAMVGYAGLKPTLSAIKAKKNIEADIREAMSPPESERALVQKLV